MEANYYTKFTSEIPSNLKERYELKTDLETQLANARERLAETKAACLSLQAEIEKSATKGEKAFGGSKDGFSKYMAARRRNTEELEIGREVVADLENNFIPKIESDLALAETNVKILLEQHLRKCRGVVDAEINSKLAECLVLIDDFMGSFRQIYNDCGSALVFNDESLIPGMWPAQEIGDMRVKLGLVPNPEPTHEQIWAADNKVESNETPPDVPPLDIPPIPAEPIRDIFGVAEPEPVVIAEPVAEIFPDSEAATSVVGGDLEVEGQ